ncbi:MAG: hypothetical protein JNM63_11785 [Spirochaetia bacterium]|nr:hypothetical protein [Spirochaetia bacterium]
MKKLIVLLVLSVFSWSFAQDSNAEAPKVEAPPKPAAKPFAPTIKVGVQVFGDLYIVASAATNLSGTNTRAKTSEFNALTSGVSDPLTTQPRYGFQLRRALVSVDGSLSDAVRGRISVIGATGFYGASATTETDPITVFEAYGMWDYLKFKDFGDESVVIGVQNTSTFKLQERIWANRALEKAAGDIYLIRRTKDLGLALKGSFFGGVLSYDFMLGNGNFVAGSAIVSNDLAPKVAYGNIGLAIPVGKDVNAAGVTNKMEILAEAYGDASIVTSTNQKWTVQGGAGFSSKFLRAGGFFTLQQSQQALGTLNTTVLSFPVWFSISELAGWKKFGLVVTGRLDLRSQDLYGINDRFIVAGIEVSPVKGFSLIPNIEIATYDVPALSAAGITPNADIVPRLTFKLIL